MAKQLFLNNFDTQFIAAVKDVPTTGTPATELDYGILRVNVGAAALLGTLTGGDYYLLTAYKRAGEVESNIEILKVTDVDTSVINETRLTVLRGQDGTSIQTYVAGDFVSLRFTKGGAANFLQEADARLTKAAVGLSNVDNTSDADKPVSTLQATALAGKEAAFAAGTTAQYLRGDKTWRDFFTDVRAATLTGLSTATNAAIAAGDTVLSALGKLQAQVTAHFGAGDTAHANVVAAGAAGFMTGADKTKLDGIASGATANTGTVTSVGLAAPAEFTVSGSPVSGAGTLTFAKAAQTANYFWAAPNGAGGAPTFRAIVAADIPTLNQNTTGTASNVTGTVAVANGGTGATTAADARTSLGLGTAATVATGTSGATIPLLNGANTHSGANTFSSTVDFTGSQRSGIVAVGALDIACGSGNYFTKTIAGNSTFTFSGAPASRAYAFTLELTHTSGTVTWPASVQWPGGTAPTLTTGKTHLFTFITDDGGTRWRGVSSVNFTN